MWMPKPKSEGQLSTRRDAEHCGTFSGQRHAKPRLRPGRACPSAPVSRRSQRKLLQPSQDGILRKAHRVQPPPNHTHDARRDYAPSECFGEHILDSSLQCWNVRKLRRHSAKSEIWHRPLCTNCYPAPQSCLVPFPSSHPAPRITTACYCIDTQSHAAPTCRATTEPPEAIKSR
jgi:hypothetical protein